MASAIIIANRDRNRARICRRPVPGGGPIVAVAMVDLEINDAGRLIHGHDSQDRVVGGGVERAASDQVDRGTKHERRCGRIVGITPVDHDLVGIQETRVRQGGGECEPVILYDFRRYCHVADCWRHVPDYNRRVLHMDTAIIVADPEVNRAAIAGGAVARCLAIVTVLVVDTELDRPVRLVQGRHGQDSRVGGGGEHAADRQGGGGAENESRSDVGPRRIIGITPADYNLVGIGEARIDEGRREAGPIALLDLGRDRQTGDDRRNVEIHSRRSGHLQANVVQREVEVGKIVLLLEGEANRLASK